MAVVGRTHMVAACSYAGINTFMKPIPEPHQNLLSGISNAHTAEQVVCCSNGVWQSKIGFNRLQGT